MAVKGSISWCGGADCFGQGWICWIWSISGIRDQNTKPTLHRPLTLPHCTNIYVYIFCIPTLPRLVELHHRILWQSLLLIGKLPPLSINSLYPGVHLNQSAQKWHVPLPRDLICTKFFGKYFFGCWLFLYKNTANCTNDCSVWCPAILGWGPRTWPDFDQLPSRPERHLCDLFERFWTTFMWLIW